MKKSLDTMQSIVDNTAAELVDIHNVKKFPRKTRTHNGAPKKSTTHKAKRHPAMAKPAIANDTTNTAWEADKAARKAARKAKPVFVKPIIPNKGMEDATEQYLIECCWEQIVAGNENAYTALDAIVGHGTNTKESVTPADVDPELFQAERSKIRKIEAQLAELPYKWGRLEERINKLNDAAADAKKKASIAKGLATKAKRAYIAADKETQKETYAKMIERTRHAKVLLAQAEKRNNELLKALKDQEEFTEMWIPTEEHLKELLVKANEKLEIAKLARRHTRRFEALEEAFAQRYERAEYVPEKEDAFRYKVYSIPAKCLFEEEIAMMSEMQKLVEEKPAGWLQQGKALYAQFAQFIKNKTGKFVVDVRNCTINNVAASQMSDIMGVEYGVKTPCKEMCKLSYDITGTFRVYWKFMGQSQEEADRKMHDLRGYVVERLLREGTKLVDGEETIGYYALLASNNSQQKQGCATMGEVETMKRTEQLREFGWMFEDALENRPDNAAEWLKRNATLTTPSKIMKIKYVDEDGNVTYRTTNIRRILMMNDVDVEQMFNNVTTIDGKQFSTAKQKKMKVTKFDGQGTALVDGIPTTQTRFAGGKVMVVAKSDYPLPEFAIDIMGNKVRVADYDILMTKSCWKAAKMGLNWYEFRNKVTEMAKTCEGYDLLRVVRYSDREIGDEENPRNLARQATQQIVKMLDGEEEELTRKTRRWLKNHKKYWNIISELGELNKPVEERTPLARLFNKFPTLVMHPYIKQFLENAWEAKKNRACSGRLRAKGVYPYICQDPIAMIQILLEGRSPYDTNLGILPEGYVNLPKVKEGREMYCVRYPANYLVGMVVKQMNVREFANLGNIAVLPYYGDMIVRADGDFDGDEMLFLFDQLMITMMKRIIEDFKPSLIDFPHGKVRCDHPFSIAIETTTDANGNKIEVEKHVDAKENFIYEVAEALVRAQEFNLVGRYSNLAVICLQQASLAKNSVTLAKWLNAAKIAHAGAIVCLDMVKGAKVPEELQNLLKNLNKNVRAAFKMPWNQLFSHPELTEEDVEPRTNSTQDKIAGCICDDVGQFEVDFEDGTPVEWESNMLLGMTPSGIDITSVKKFVVDDEDLRRISGCHFDDTSDEVTWTKMMNGEAIGWKEWLELGWHNASALLWKMTGVDMAEKRNDLYAYIRKVLIKSIYENAWEREDGEYTLVEKYASLVTTVVESAFEYRVKDGKVVTEYVDKNGKVRRYGNNLDAEKKGSYAMFILRVFARDILALADSGNITENMVKALCYVANEEEDRPAQFWDEYEYDTQNYVCEENMCFSVYDDDEEDYDGFSFIDEAC